jgi:hypothetical protein
MRLTYEFIAQDATGAPFPMKTQEVYALIPGKTILVTAAGSTANYTKDQAESV